MVTKVRGSVWDAEDNVVGVSVKDHGVLGDGATDDSSAIQAAVDYIEGLISGTVAQQNTFNSYILHFPAGRYLIDTQIVITKPGIIVKGAGTGATTIQHTSNTGAFMFRHADYLDGQNMDNNGIMDLELLGTASATNANDVAVKAYICRFFRVERVRFTNWSAMLDMFACEEPIHITDCVFWHGNALLTSNASVRMFALEVNDGTPNAFVDADTGLDYYSNSMVFMDNCEFRALASTANHHILLEGVDGLYANNCHFLNATNQLDIDPVSSAVGIGNVVFSNCFFDGSLSATSRNVYVETKTFTSDMSVFNLAFDNCKFNGSDVENIRLDHADLQDFVVKGGMIDLGLGNYFINAQFGVRLFELNGTRLRFGGGGPDLGAALFDARNSDFFDSVVVKNVTVYPSGGAGGVPVRIFHIESDGTNAPIFEFSGITYTDYSALVSMLDDDSSPAVEIHELNNVRLGTEQATGTYTMDPGTSITEIDSTGGAVTATLGSARTPGFIKTIVMTNASNSSTVSVTNHETTDPEVITFAAVDDTAVLQWTGTEWITIKLSGATV